MMKLSKHGSDVITFERPFLRLPKDSYHYFILPHTVSDLKPISRPILPRLCCGLRPRSQETQMELWVSHMILVLVLLVSDTCMSSPHSLITYATFYYFIILFNDRKRSGWWRRAIMPSLPSSTSSHSTSMSSRTFSLKTSYSSCSGVCSKVWTDGHIF